jgi:hypothetical protein
VFTTERLENLPLDGRARETWRITGADEFVEIFELAEPGKDFAVYSETQLTRRRWFDLEVSATIDATAYRPGPPPRRPPPAGASGIT